MLAVGLLGITSSVATAHTDDTYQVWINEFAYDTAGDPGEVNEFVEVAFHTGVDISGWRIVRYDGSADPDNAAVVSSPAPLDGYSETNLGDTAITGPFLPANPDFRFAVVRYPTGALPKGPHGGFALVAPDDTVVQLLSYEGTFTAGAGPAQGMTSTDIDVRQFPHPVIHPPGASLQLNGTGNRYSHFTWTCYDYNRMGQPNTGQTFFDPDVELTKAAHPESGAGHVRPGERITYTITVANLSSVDISGITVTDQLPHHTTFVSASHGGTVDNGVITWSDLELIDACRSNAEPLELNVVVEVDAVVPAGVDEIANTAVVDAPGDDHPDNDTDGATVPLVADPELTLAVVCAPQTVIVGNSLTVGIEVANQGDQRAADVEVVYVLPDGFGFASASHDGVLDGDRVRWRFADSGALPDEFDVGAPITLTATLTADAAVASASSTAQVTHLDGAVGGEVTAECVTDVSEAFDRDDDGGESSTTGSDVTVLGRTLHAGTDVQGQSMARTGGSLELIVPLGVLLAGLGLFVVTVVNSRRRTPLR